MANVEKILQLAQFVLESESTAIIKLKDQLDQSFLTACEWLAACQGHVVLIGLGKSGYIARKIAATMSSVGSPAFFLHPTEACHGDFGMVKSNDLAILLSHSGETEELNQVVTMLHALAVKTIAITARTDSSLAKSCDVCLATHVTSEACTMGLAPTTSTTVTLAMGDALAVAVSHIKGFTSEDFACFHPQGQLGRSLLLKVKDIMRIGKDIPLVSEDRILRDVLYEITNKKFGMTMVCAGKPQAGATVTGVFTDGDLRRTLDKKIDVQTTPIGELMTRNFYSIHSDALAVEALKMCEQHAISGMPVIDDGRLVGALNFHDLLNAKIKS